MTFKKGESGFADRTHTVEARAKIGAAKNHLGKSHDAKMRRLISNATKLAMRKLSKVSRNRMIEGGRNGGLIPKPAGFGEKVAEGLTRYMSQFPKPQTPLERALISLLEGAGFAVDEQVRFGRYIVDIYDPENGLVWEADGTFWHQDKKKEKTRDEYLLERGVAAVIHLSEQDLKGGLE